MTEDAPFSEALATSLVAELKRIFGDDLDSVEAPRFFMLLPLINEAEFLDFLRSIPAGTAWLDLLELASQYRAAHPVRNLPSDR